MLHSGLGRYGKSDQVPGLFYVVTEFLSVSYFPLYPVNSYLVYERTGGSIAIGLIWKSVILAWLRAMCCVGAIALGIVGMVGIADLKGNFAGAYLGIFLAPIPLLLGWASYPLSRAGPSRAIRVASKANIQPEDLAPYFLHWKSLSLENSTEDTRTS